MKQYKNHRYVDANSSPKRSISNVNAGVNTTNEQDPGQNEIRDTLQNLEAILKETQSEMREFFARESIAASETNSRSSMNSLTTNDSRHYLDDRFIQSRLKETQVRNI